MKCEKINNRTFFDLFRVFNCSKCDNYNKDEYIIIGKRLIFLYNIHLTCNKIDITDDYMYFDKKVKRILYDYCLYENKNLLLWISINKPLEFYENILEAFMDLGYNIHIIND